MPLTQAQRKLLLDIARRGLLDKLIPGEGGERATAASTAPAAVDPSGADPAVVDPAAADPAASERSAPHRSTAATDPAAIDPADVELTTPAGCFVSLHERQTHRLRGCVGRLDPEMPLWRTVRETAGDVLRDPRFTDAPVTAAEIPSLELEVSVLSPPREASGPLDFDPGSDGIYLIFGTRSGFFLPQVARDTGWSRQQLLHRLCQEKLGLPADAWQKPEAKLFTFKVEVIGPERV